MNASFNQRIRKYFKHINLYREDIKELLDKCKLNLNGTKICDFGCGSGITTFAFALEIKKSFCIGLDLFSEDSPYSFDEISQIENRIKDDCLNKSINSIKLKELVKEELCELFDDKRFPSFIKGDILTGENIPKDCDLAFCQKIFINIHEGKHGNERLGSEAVSKSIKNIASSLLPEGHLLSIEFTNFDLNPYIEQCGLEIIKSFNFTRNDVRSKGRTEVISNYTAFLCKKINNTNSKE